MLVLIQSPKSRLHGQVREWLLPPKHVTAFWLYVWVWKESEGKENDYSRGRGWIIMGIVNEKITGSQQATLFMSNKKINKINISIVQLMTFPSSYSFNWFLWRKSLIISTWGLIFTPEGSNPILLSLSTLPTFPTGRSKQPAHSHPTFCVSWSLRAFQKGSSFFSVRRL